MRQVKEILRQKWLLGRTHRAVGQSIGVGAGSVGDVIARAKAAGLKAWSDVEPKDEVELEQQLYATRAMACGPRPLPDAAYLDVELRRKGVTLQLLRPGEVKGYGSRRVGKEREARKGRFLHSWQMTVRLQFDLPWGAVRGVDEHGL